MHNNDLLQDLLSVSKKVQVDPYSGFVYEFKKGRIRFKYLFVTDIFFLDDELGKITIGDGVATLSQSVSGNNAFVSFTLDASDEETALKLFRNLDNLISPSRNLKRMIIMTKEFSDISIAQKLQEFYYVSGKDLDQINEIEELMKIYRPQLMSK